MPLHYISGCNTRIALVSDEPFRLQSGQNLKALCPTNRITKARSHRAAVATCRGCPRQRVPTYVEPPDDDELAPPPPTPVGGRPAARAPVDDPDLDFDFWGGSEDDEASTPPQRKIANPPRSPRPPPKTLHEVAVDIPEPAIERNRPKEAPLDEAEIWSETPPATPPSMLPPYEPPNTPPPSYELDERGCRITPTEILRRCWRPDLTRGPSLLGHSKLNDSHVCLRRFFWRWVLGLSPAPTPEHLKREAADTYLNPLDVGGLVHLVLEIWRRTGGFHAWEPLYLLRGDYAPLVLEVKRLVEAYVAGNRHDAATWDLRACELESRYYYPPRKCRGKRRRLCISARADAVYHPLQRGEPRQPPGVPCRNIRLVETKTSKQRPGDSLVGYRVNSQILQLDSTYTRGVAVDASGGVLTQSNAERHGALAGVMLDWLVKARDFDPYKHLARQVYRLQDANLDAYLADEGDWLYDQIGDRLFSPQATDPETWPRSWQCHGLFYPQWVCGYHLLCDAAAPWKRTAAHAFIQDDAYTVTGELLELPKARARGRKASWKRQRAAADVEDK